MKNIITKRKHGKRRSEYKQNVCYPWMAPKWPHTCDTSTARSQISIFLAPKSTIFELQAILRQVHQMTQKWPWTLQSYEKYPRLLKFQSVSFYGQPFSSCRPFWDKCTEWPQMTLNIKSSRVTHRHATITPPPPSRISLRFAPWSSVFELQAILRQLLQMTPKWNWTLKCQRYPIYMLQLHQTPKFQSVLLCGQRFSRSRPFWDKCTEWSQNDPNTKRSKLPHIHFTPISLFIRFELQLIFRQVHRMTPKWPWTFKGTPYMLYK